MNRAICLTVVSMLASVAWAAAVASSAEPSPLPRIAERVAVAAPAPGVVPPRGQAGSRMPALQAPRCEPDEAAPYRQWHHGGLKLAPGCAEPSRG